MPGSGLVPARAALLLGAGLLLSSCAGRRPPVAVPMVAVAPRPQATVARIAFGSCLRQGRPQPIWDGIRAYDPQLVLLLGDNVYADTTDPAVLRQSYQQLIAEPGFARLRARVPVVAIWDDHDYGQDDAGADNPIREASEALFLEFLEPRADAVRLTRPGIYDSLILGPPGRRVQLILLDGRSFRSPRGAVPNADPGATVLGHDQWRWLDRELRQPAELRLVVSGIQILADGVARERWADFPRERARLLALIARSGATGVILLSGDRHFGELSRLDQEPYPLFDLTSSGLNVAVGRDSAEDLTNHHRLGEPYLGDNFGTVTIDWSRPDPTVTLAIRDRDGTVQLQQVVALSALGGRRGGAR